jgi:hypothetical protein
METNYKQRHPASSSKLYSHVGKCYKKTRTAEATKNRRPQGGVAEEVFDLKGTLPTNKKSLNTPAFATS